MKHTRAVTSIHTDLPFSSHSGDQAIAPIMLCLLLLSGSHSLYFVLAALRYLRSDGRLNSVIFSNIQLADGKRHAVLLRLSGLHRGSSKVEMYVDCMQVDVIQDLPKAFSGLSQSPEFVELRTLQRKAQVSAKS